MIYNDLVNGLPGAKNAAAVDISAADAALSPACRFLYIGGTGAVKVDTEGGQTVTFSAVPVGYLYVRATKVYKTGTTATNIVALY